MSNLVKLESVKDKETFLKFLEEFVSDRQRAEELESEDPKKWSWGGANGWQNSDISMFLESASCYFHEGPECHSGETLSWKDLAEFLYYGKIYE